MVLIFTQFGCWAGAGIGIGELLESDDDTPTAFVGPPTEFALIDPSTSLAVMSDTPTFHWTNPDGENHFTLEVNTDPTFVAPPVYFNDNIPANTGSFTLPSGLLTIGATYRWRMTAENNSGSTPPSNTKLTFVPLDGPFNRAYGGDGATKCYDFDQDSAGGFTLTGRTNAYGVGGFDVWVVNLNNDLSKNWGWTYGGTNTEMARAIVSAPNGDTYVAARAKSFGAGSEDFWILCLKPDGSIRWQKTYGGPQSDIPESIVVTPEGDLVVAGRNSSFDMGGGDGWVLKLTEDGDVIWERTYGGTGTDGFAELKNTSDGGYVAVGTTASFGPGGNDVWVIKLANDGTLTWQETYGGAGNDEGKSIQQSSEGGYIVSGSTNSFGGAGQKEMWVLKLNAAGAVTWDFAYGRPFDDRAFSIQQTDDDSDGQADDGYVLCGPMAHNAGAQTSDGLIVKIDSVGTIEYQKVYGDWGGLQRDETMWKVQQDPNGFFLLAGENSSSMFGGQTDLLVKGWFFRTNPDLTLGGFGKVVSVTVTNTTATAAGGGGTNSPTSATVQDTTITPILINAGKLRVP